MTGTFKDVKKYLSAYCFIEGSDGETYFCHKDDMTNELNKAWKYVYNGNICTFDISENAGEKHKRAINIHPAQVADPNGAEKRAKAAEQKARVEEKARIKAENKRKAAAQKARADRKKQSRERWDEHIAEHTAYIVETHESGEWEPLSPIVAFSTVEKAKDLAKELKAADAGLYRARKVLRYELGDKVIIKEYKKRR